MEVRSDRRGMNAIETGFVYVAGYDGVVVLTSGKYSESRLITEGCSELLLSELDRVF